MQRLLLLLWVPVAVITCFAFAGERAEAEEALASWYGPGFSGLPTASGEPYDPYGLTAAHKTMPLGTELLVSYGGSAVEVTVNDRGPYIGERELDLSQGAAEVLGLTAVGVDYVGYSWTDPYGDAPQDVSATQYAATGEEAYGSVSATHYVQNETIASDQYSIPEEYPVEVAAEPVPAAAEAVAVDSSGVVAGAAVDGSVLVVRPGETLSGIAAEAGVPESYLASRNVVADPNYIYAGQVLYY